MVLVKLYIPRRFDQITKNAMVGTLIIWSESVTTLVPVSWISPRGVPRWSIETFPVLNWCSIYLEFHTSSYLTMGSNLLKEPSHASAKASKFNNSSPSFIILKEMAKWRSPTKISSKESKGDLVEATTGGASKAEYQGNMGPTWEEPYIILEACGKGSYKLKTLDVYSVDRT
ncbi:hypothetical protein Tco_0877472 [Tanacetum coccineum]|uniref:Uncharacterized protein n=1 Tax=Tanacetum coccineum TaxID=301880 RepID=A0ABQ5BXW5_9ASTR